MTEDVIQLLTPEGHLIEHPDYPLDVDAGLLRTLYRDIVLTRRTDVESTALQRTGELGLWCPVLGQEGVQIGAGHAMRPSVLWIYDVPRGGHLPCDAVSTRSSSSTSIAA